MFRHSIGSVAPQRSASNPTNRLKNLKLEHDQRAALSSTVKPVSSDSELIPKISQEKLNSLLKKQLTEKLGIPLLAEELYPGIDFGAEECAISHITKNYQQGLREGKTEQELTQLLNQSAENYRAAYSQTSAILEKMGQLGPEQKDFLSRSENRVERGMASIEEYWRRENSAESDERSFELEVETQEGDVVTIRFTSSQGVEKEGMEYQSSNSRINTLDTFEVSYEVEGKLSDEEHQALQAIFANVGELADDYFGVQPKDFYENPFRATKTDFSTNLLAGFDSEQLASLDLSMTFSRVDTFDYSYEFNPASQEQSLSVEHRSCYSPFEFDITTSTIGGRDAEQLARYLDVLDSNFEEVSPGLDSRTKNELAQSIDAYKALLTSLFDLSAKHTRQQEQAAEHFANGRQLVADLTNELIRNDERYQKTPSTEKRSIHEGISNLADFKAEFTFAGDCCFGYFHMTQKQETEFTQEDELQGLKQSKSYELNTLSGATIDREKRNTKSEHYEAKTVAEKGEVVALDQTHHAAQYSYEICDYVGPTSYTSKWLDETSDSSNSLRLIEGIWTQEVSSQKESQTDRVVLENREMTSHLVKVEREAHQKKALIGELDKLNNKGFIKYVYAPHLERVNKFMTEV